MRKLSFIFVLLVSGCASTSTIDQGFESVDYSDGINAVEAKRIAQKFLLGQPSANEYAVSMPDIDTDIFSSFPEWKGKAWVVGFAGKSFNIFNRYYQRMFVVAVDKKTGNIRFYQDGYGPGAVPFEMQSYGEQGLSIR